MSDLAYLKIIDIATVRNGSTPSTKDIANYNGNIVWITPNDLSKQQKKYIYKGERNISQTGYDSCSTILIPKGSILLSSRAPIGLLAIAGVELCTNQGFKNLVPKPNINSDFLYYYLRTKINEIDKLGTGTTFKEVSKSAIENFNILIPRDINQQRRIASVLSALDDKIEVNNRINTELEAMAKTLYDYWFVQFDFPDANGKPYKSSGGKMVYSKELKREIPEGWEVKSLCDIATIIAGGDKPQNISENKNDYFSVPIYSNGIENQGLYGYTNQARINEQSITISARGTIGFCVLRTQPFFPIIRLIAITPLKKEYLKYLYEYLKTTPYENSGSVQQQLTVPQISKLNVVYPPTEITTLFHNFTQPNIKRVSTNQQENQQLASLRDWLLPMLMNGQVGFKEDTKKETPIINLSQQDQDQRFELWLSGQGLAARGEIDKITLREIFNLMDEEEHGK